MAIYATVLLCPLKVNGQQERAFLDAHPKGALSVAFSSDGKLMASGGRDGRVLVWDATTGKVVDTLAHERPIHRLAFCPKTGVLAVSTGRRGMDGTFPVVVLWKANPGKRLRELVWAGWGMAYSPNGALLATASGRTGDTIVLWDPKTGKEEAELKGHTKPITGLAISPDGKLLASLSEDQTVRIWDLKTCKEVTKWVPFKGGDVSDIVYCVAFSPDGKTVAAGSRHRIVPPPPGFSDPDVKFWNVAAGKEVGGIVRCASCPVQCLAYSPDGKLVALGGRTNDLEFVDVGTEKKEGFDALMADCWAHLYGRKNASILALAFSPDGQRVVTGNSDGSVSLWEVPKKRIKRDLEAEERRNDEERSHRPR